MKWIGKHPVFSDLMIGSVLLTPPDNQYEYELTLPDNDGTAGQVLTTDGNGVLTWVTNSAGGTGVSMTNGVDNRVMTATAAQDITGEADLTFDSETLTIGADDDGEATIQRTTHSDDTGGNLCIKAGNATGTDKAGGRLELKAGLGTGEGSTDSGGDIRFYTAWKGSSGSSQQNGHLYPMFEFQSPTATRNDFIIYEPGASQNDYFTIRTSTHGATDIRTIDSAAAAANLEFNIDGQFSVASTGIDISGAGVISNAEWQGTDVAIAHGGTGQSTAQAAIDAISQVSGASAGEALIKDGSGNATWAAQTNTTYSAGDGLDLSGTTFSADIKADSGIVIDSTELSMDLGASSITGTLAVGDGGTGATSLTDNAILSGTGSSAITAEDTSISSGIISRSGTIELAGTTVTLDSGGDIELEVGATSNYVDTDGAYRGGNVGPISDTFIPIMPVDFITPSSYRYPAYIDVASNGKQMGPGNASTFYFCQKIIPKGYTASTFRVNGVDGGSTASTFTVYQNDISGSTAVAVTVAFAFNTDQAAITGRDIVGDGSKFATIVFNPGDTTDYIYGGKITIAKT